MRKLNRVIRQCICLIFFLILFVSCEKNEDLTDQVEFLQVEFLESSYFGICFCGTPSGLDHEVIITDNESYQEYWNQKRIYPFNLDCDTAELPKINFDKYSLIGKYTSGGGCDVSYYRDIIDNKTIKKIVYTINVEYSGSCYMLITNMNWALIPKLKNDYEVEFLVR